MSWIMSDNLIGGPTPKVSFQLVVPPSRIYHDRHLRANSITNSRVTGHELLLIFLAVYM